MGYNAKQIEKLWVQAGGNPSAAPLMASIAMAESGGNPAALNTNANTHDYSAGLWQINYFGNLGPDRTAKYGPVSSMYGNSRAAALANARAAVNLYDQGKGIGNWQGDRAYEAYMKGGPQALAPFLNGAPTGNAGALASSVMSGNTGTLGSGLDAFFGGQPGQSPQQDLLTTIIQNNQALQNKQGQIQGFVPFGNGQG